MNTFYLQGYSHLIITALISISLFSLLPTTTEARTTLGGTITGTAFTANGNPYIIEKTLTIPEDAKIVINEGCQFFFKPFTGIIVNGSLVVTGTEEQPVLFSSINDSLLFEQTGQLPNPFDWNGIVVSQKADEVELSHFMLRHSVYGIKSQTASIVIRDGLFEKNGQFHFAINDNIKQVIEAMSYTYETHGVTYNPNGADNGNVPADSNRYNEGEIVKVPGNSGMLVKRGSSFFGWNSSSDGTGIDYPCGSNFIMGKYDVTLHARWTGQDTNVLSNRMNISSAPVSINSADLVKKIAPFLTTGACLATGVIAGWSMKRWHGYNDEYRHEPSRVKQNDLKRSTSVMAIGAIASGAISVTALTASIFLFVRNSRSAPKGMNITIAPFNVQSSCGIAVACSIPDFDLFDNSQHDSLQADRFQNKITVD